MGGRHLLHAPASSQWPLCAIYKADGAAVCAGQANPGSPHIGALFHGTLHRGQLGTQQRVRAKGVSGCRAFLRLSCLLSCPMQCKNAVSPHVCEQMRCPPWWFVRRTPCTLTPTFLWLVGLSPLTRGPLYCLQVPLDHHLLQPDLHCRALWLAAFLSRHA